MTFRLGIIFGGPSEESGISINSARTLVDHLGWEMEIRPYYVNKMLKFYKVDSSELYSNTPSDFDFKLEECLDDNQIISELRRCDMVFPAIHGRFGEDGQLQKFLEENQIPFVGSSSSACATMFPKDSASKVLSSHQMLTLDSLSFSSDTIALDVVSDFVARYKKVVVKPAAGGSSIGVKVGQDPQSLYNHALMILERIDSRVVIEEFCYGQEFTVLVLQNGDQHISLIPSQICISYDNNQIFDYRRKYLPTTNTKWLCPPHFESSFTTNIMRASERVAAIFGARDFVRIDGWIRSSDQAILFTDINPISGLEQNSFIFQQSAKIGMTHRDVLRYIVRNASARYAIDVPEQTQVCVDKKNIHVLFGGSSSERQVSLMSGTNVWLKLLRSDKFDPKPYFLDKSDMVWEVPYSCALSHTVEEVLENCCTYNNTTDRISCWVDGIRTRLGLKNADQAERLAQLEPVSLSHFVRMRDKDEFVFIALHGGIGENGYLQTMLTAKYNGSCAFTSKICMDKLLTGEKINNAAISGVYSLQKYQISNTSDLGEIWHKCEGSYIIKPQDDGCSSGIVRIESFDDLKKYFDIVNSGVSCIAPHAFADQNSIVEVSTSSNYILERFIQTDLVRIVNQEVVHSSITGFIEMTVGFIEAQQEIVVFDPSITIAQDGILSVEEKFQGGTGINLTPPPANIISAEQIQDVRQKIQRVVQALNMKNYGRIDIFYNRQNNDLIVIEANTLPALTPSTVLYHQALKKGIAPVRLLEMIIESAIS